MAVSTAFENENTPSTLTSPPPQHRFAAGSNFLSAIRPKSTPGHVKKACAAMIILAGSLALGGCNPYEATPGEISPQGDRNLATISASTAILNGIHGGYFFNKTVNNNGEIRGIKSTDYHAGHEISELVFPVPKGAKEVGFSRDHANAALTYVTDKRYLENWQCDVDVDKPGHAEMTNLYYQGEKGTWHKTPEKKETITGTISDKPTAENKIMPQGDRNPIAITQLDYIWIAIHGGPFLNEAVYENGEIRGIKSTDYHAGHEISELVFPVPKGAKEVEFSRNHAKAYLIYVTDKKYRENWECDVYVDKPCHAEMTNIYYQDEKGTWQKTPEKKETITGTIPGK